MQQEELICNNLRLVHACCKRFVGRGVEYDDLYGAGCVGLVKAAGGFQPERGFCFSTYAVPVILGEMKRLFRDGGAVKVSRGLKELSQKALKARAELSGAAGHEVGIAELARFLKVEPEEVAEALCAARPPESLSYEGEDGEVKELQIGTAKSAEDEVADKIAVDQLLCRLPEQDRELIKLRYFQNKTQTETAKQLFMTQVQVSRREKKLLQLMAQLLAG